MPKVMKTGRSKNAICRGPGKIGCPLKSQRKGGYHTGAGGTAHNRYPSLRGKGRKR